MPDDQIIQNVMGGAGNGGQATYGGSPLANPQEQVASVTAPDDAPRPQPTTNPAVPAGAQIPPASDASAMAVKEANHDRFAGRATKHIFSALHGGDGSKPGDIFRHILAGALLGGAVGAQTDPRKGFIGGFARGGGAVEEHNEQMATQKRAEDREEASMAEEHRQHLAEQGVWQAQIAHFDAEADHLREETIKARNERSEKMEKVAKDAGGVPSHMIVDGKPVDGTVSAEAISKEIGKGGDNKNKILFAPQGYVRRFMDTTNLRDIEYDPTRNVWIEDGHPVDMTDKISLKAYDIPQNAMTTPQPHTAAEMHKLFPTKFPAPKTGEEDHIYPVTPQQMFDAQQAEEVIQQKLDDSAFKKSEVTRNEAEATKFRAEALKATADAHRAHAEKAKDHATLLKQAVEKKDAEVAKAEERWGPSTAGGQAKNAYKLQRDKQLAQDKFEHELQAIGATPGHYKYEDPGKPSAAVQQAVTTLKTLPKDRQIAALNDPNLHIPPADKVAIRKQLGLPPQ